MLSFVVPTLQEEKAIGPMLRWIREKVTLPKEIIVADGRSTDKTVERARGLADKILISKGVAPSPARQRNQGGFEASGEYIVFLDCDVTIENPDWFFSHAISEFEKDPKLVAITGPQRARPGCETWADRINFGILNYGIRFKNNVLHIGEVSGKFMLVRKSAFHAVKGLRDDLITREDANFFKRLSHIGKTRYYPELMIFHGARRAHAIGWWRLWYVWLFNTLWVSLFDKAYVNEWVPIREYDNTCAL
jgi:glycosyltransferase involved in cell wall biosynthesis